MKLKYDESIIEYADTIIKKNKYYNSNNIKELLINKKGSYLYNNYSISTIICRLGLENYILKNNNTRELKEYIEYMKTKLLEGFKKDPTKYCDSLLLKEENASNIFSDKEYSELTKTKKLYIETMRNIVEKDPSSEKDRHSIIKYFNLNIDTHDKIQTSYISDMINNGIFYEDPEELKFLLNFIVRKYISCAPNIYVIKINDKTIESYQYDNNIFINFNSYVKSIPEIIEIAFKEVSRYKEGNISLKENTLKAYEYAIHDLIIENIGVDLYNNNYQYSSIEEEAEEDGYYYAERAINEYGRKKEAELLKEMLLQKKENRLFRLEFVEEKNMTYLIEQYTVKRLDEIISKHPDKINKYPVLLNIYNKDGKTKSFDELIKVKSAQNKIEILYNHIINYLIKGSLKNFDINNISKLQYKNVFKNIELYLDILTSKLNKMTDPKDLNIFTLYYNQKYDVSPQLYKKIYINYLKIIDVLIGYLIDNIDNLTIEKEKLIYKINNIIKLLEKEKQSTIAKEELDKSLNKYLEKIKAYNRKNVIKEVNSKLSENQKNKIITFKEKRITLNDYLTNIVPQTFDNNSFSLTVHINGKPIELEKYIELIKKNVTKLEKTEIKIPTFNDLKRISSKYDFNSTKATEDNPYGILIIDNKTGATIKDQSIIDQAVFADIWRTVVGTSYHENDNKPGDTIAFLPSNREIYNYICKLFKTEIIQNAHLDILKLYKIALSDNKKAAEIIVELLRHPGRALLIEEYFKKVINNEKL